MKKLSKIIMTAEEKTILAEFFESHTYKIFKKHLIDAAHIELRDMALWGDPKDGHRLSNLQGQAARLTAIHGTLKKVHKEEGDKDAKSRK